MSQKKSVAIVFLSEYSPKNAREVKAYFNALNNHPWSLKTQLKKKRITKRWQTLCNDEFYEIISNEEQDVFEGLRKTLMESEQSFLLFHLKNHSPISLENIMSDVRSSRPDELILLPLYHQFSKHMVGDVFQRWSRLAKKRDMHIPTKYVCCHLEESLLLDIQTQLILNGFSDVFEKHPTRLLFCLNGFFSHYTRKDDVYLWQAEKMARKIIQNIDADNVDYRLCFYSSIERSSIIEPNIKREIRRAAIENRAVVAVPFFSMLETFENIVTLDKLMKEYAQEIGFQHYNRAPSISTEPVFIEAIQKSLQSLATQDFHSKGVFYHSSGCRKCIKGKKSCPMPLS